ncbi:hypothetical protein LOY39_23910 [Pseudomonas rhodesiae]|uniref:hypothetical protein n=1 Tax=Pseudomonas rhodesiae TaxID=76760 RepID=UPI002160589B|nr:hypothetical protein [Pseudomonas rhodesiae]UVL08675.1 hypothetical protein LOY39_23910 [Pseudomonas rhodesiae]
MDTLVRHLPRLRWHLMQWRQRLGFWGLLAVGVMATVLLIEVVLIQPASSADSQRRQALQAGIDEQPQDVQVTEPAVVEALPTARDFAPRLEKTAGPAEPTRFHH